MAQSLDVKGNYAKAESFIRAAADQGAQLTVLPEFHLQGWVASSNTLRLCATQSAEYLECYQALAQELQICIVPGTLLEDTSSRSETCQEPTITNVSYFIGSDGGIHGRYHKRNLWHPEKPILRPPEGHGAQHHVAFDTPLGIRMGMLICWDLSFPEAFRALAADGARLVIVPSFWVAKDKGEPVNYVNLTAEELFINTMCVARAFENSCAVVYVNCGGATGGGSIPEGYDAEGRQHAGLSQVAVPMLGSLGKIEHRMEGMSVVELDMELLDIAERAYKPLDDMEKRGWKYEADLSGI